MEDNNINPTESTENTGNTKQCDTSCNCKCRLSLIMNLVLFAGLVVLYILYFMDRKSGDVNSAVLQKSNKAVSVGYVNSDSIMASYTLVEHMKDSLEAQTKKFEEQFNAAQSTFQVQVTDYQKKVKANTLSIEQATATEKALGQKQEALLAMKDELTAKLAQQEQELNNVLQDSIMSCLKRYNKKYNFDYILGFSKGSGILYANDSLNITGEIINELNKGIKPKK
jgi:outer membrane protein